MGRAASAAARSALDRATLLGLLGFRVKVAYNVLVAWYDEYIGRASGLREVEFSVLSVLAANAEVTPKQLSHCLGISPPNLAVVIARLEVAGLVVRRTSPDDRRSYRIEATRRARVLTRRAVAAAQGMEAELMRGWTPAERAMLIALLEKLSESLPAAARIQRRK